MALYGTSGTVRTGVPLGQFEIQAAGTGNDAVTLTSGGAGPVFVWVLPTGVCVTPDSPATDPCTTPSTAPVAVTVG